MKANAASARASHAVLACTISPAAVVAGRSSRPAPCRRVRPHTLRPRRQQDVGARSQRRLLLGSAESKLVQPIEDRLAFPVAGVCDAVGQPEGVGIGAEQPIDLGCVPRRTALFALAVGIKAGGEGVFDQHLPLQPSYRLENTGGEQRIMGVCPGV